MKNEKNSSSSVSAFTRLELVMVLAGLVVLGGVARSSFASNKRLSEQALCLSNLRQVGHAFQLWANDHGDRNPWWTPVSEGGSYLTINPLAGNAWFQMQWISNELVTPKILVCPSDLGVGAPRQVATDFSITNLNGGFSAIGFRDRALSYFIGIHSGYDSPRSVLSGDRNIRWSSNDNSCVSNLRSVWAIFRSFIPNGWTNSIHFAKGNLLFSDGTVEQLSGKGLQTTMAAPNYGDRGAHHFLAPN